MTGIAGTLQDLFRQGAEAVSPGSGTLMRLAADYNTLQRDINQVDSLRRQATSGTADVAAQALAQLEAMGLGGSPESGPSVSMLTTYIKDLRDEQDRIFSQIVAIPGGPEFAYSNWPNRYGEIVDFISSSGGSGGGSSGRVAAGPSYQFQFAQNGDLYRISSDGSFEFMQNIPEFAERNVQVVTDSTTGEAFALAMDNEGNVTNRTSLGQFAFPEIDPERIFQRELLFQAANIEQAFAGLELQRRGMLVDAIGNDFANQIALGRMTYEEANQRLNTVNSALDQRRLEREAILQYGVTRESLRTLPSGEVVTRLPFADQMASILSGALGTEFRPEDFEIGVTAVNPEQAAQDVINAGQFTSPLPALYQGLQGTRDAISQIFAEPLGDFAVSNQIINQATQGI